MRPTHAPLAALLALTSLLSASPVRAQEEAAPPDVACKEEKATCKEGCSLDYGLSESTRGKVPKCLADCEQAEVICLARFVAKRHAGRVKTDRERYTVPVEDVGGAPIDDDLPPVRKRTSTRAADLKAAPDRDPDAYQEKVHSEPVPAPTPQPAPAIELEPLPKSPSPTKARPKKKKKSASSLPPVD